MSRLILALHLVLLALLPACLSSNRVVATPDPAGLAGRYRFEGLPGPVDLPNPLIPFDEVRAGSDVGIVQESGQVVVGYVLRDGRSAEGRLDLEDLPEGVTWSDGVLETRVRQPIEGPVILPGLARQFRGTRLFRSEDGSLHVVTFAEERGLMLFLIPFVDHHEGYELVLPACQGGP